LFLPLDNDIQATVLLFNVKKMISDFHEKVSSFGNPKPDPDVPPEQFAEYGSSVDLKGGGSLRKKFPPLLTKKSSITALSASEEERIRKADHEKDRSEQPQVKWEAMESSTEFSLMRILMSILASWDLDPAIDHLCEEKLGMRRFPPHVTLTISGLVSFLLLFIYLLLFANRCHPSSSANGNLAIQAPNRQSQNFTWAISPFLNAVRLLCLTSLAKCVFAVKGLEEDIIRVITHYCTLLPDKVSNFKEPALATLAKFWQDPSPDIQQSARSLIVSSISRLPKEKKLQVIDYWAQFCESPLSLLFFFFLLLATTHLALFS